MKIFNPENSNEKLDKLPATGILLAGGKNTRMRTNKAFLEYNGQFLVERSLNILRRIFNEVLISSNQPELYEKFNTQVIRDVYPERGPIGGLHAGLLNAKFDIVFFVACDMPLIQADMIRYLYKWTNQYEVVVPQGRKGLHPLHAYYNRTCLTHIENHLLANALKIISFYPNCSVKFVGEQDLRHIGDIDQILKNVNTPEEWKAFKEILE